MSDIERYRPGLGRNAPLVQQLKEFQRNPRSLVFASLAETYRQEGLPEQALDILEEGLDYHPGLPSALLCRARCLFDLRRYAEALADVRSLLNKNPDNLKAHKLEAEIYVRLGQRKAAIRSLTRVVALFPQDREAVKALEELENLELKQKIPLERLSRASVDTPPTLGKIDDFQVDSFSSSLASIQSMSPDPLAEPSEEKEEEDEPTFATRTIAELYLRQGLRKKAVRVLRALLRDDPAHSWARETLQELESNGIVLPASGTKKPRESSLERKAKALEKMLAQVRLLKREGA